MTMTTTTTTPLGSRPHPGWPWGAGCARWACKLLACVCTLGAGATQAQTQPAGSVVCRVQSGDLRFGVLNPHSPSSPSHGVGEGLIVLSCQNLTQAAQSHAVSLAISVAQSRLRSNNHPKNALTVGFFHDPIRSQAWGDGRNGGAPLKLLVQLLPGEHRLLRLPVHALLQGFHQAPVGAYQAQVPLSLTQSSEH